jgi:predicted kinase
MRKWMRERLQRRKKAPAEQASQPALPPLQPAYFDANENSAEPAAPPAERSQPQPDSTQGYEPESMAQSTQEATSAAETTERAGQPRTQRAESSGGKSSGQANQRGRGRRRRGGRGRGGSGRERAVAQAFAPAAGKGTIPEINPDASEVAPAELAAADVELGVTDAEADAEAASPAPEIPAVTPAAPSRPPKGIVVLAIGLPGSGKSSWFKRHNLVPLSSDILRSLLFDDVREQRFQDLVFSNLRSMLKARLIAKRPMNYVDATNLTPQERQHWIKLAKDYNYEVHAVFFDVPVEVCIERHQRRDRVVPEDVMRRMAAKLKPPSFEEGFAKITVVRVKKKD